MNTQISNGVKKLILGAITLFAIFGLALFVMQAVAKTNGSGERKIVVFSSALSEVAKDKLISIVGWWCQYPERHRSRA